MKAPALLLALLLAGCAPSPLESARRAEAARLEQERLNLALSHRCDPEVGRLLELQRLGWPQVADRPAAAAELARRQSVPSFQNCLALGWENLAQRERLERLERRQERWERQALRPWPRPSLFYDFYDFPYWED